jgi:hypothetical protein
MYSLTILCIVFATRSILRSSERKQAEAGNQCRPLSVIGGAVPSARGDHLEPANGCSLARSPSSTGFSGKKSQDNVFLYFKGIVWPDWIYMRVVPLDRLE